MVSYEEAMKMNKETLASRLANRSNGGHSSRLIPVTGDGIKLVTAGQEIGLVGCAFESVPGHGGPYNAVDHAKQGDWGEAFKEYLQALNPWKTFSGKVVWGSTVAGLVGNALKRRGRTVRAGIFKLN